MVTHTSLPVLHSDTTIISILKRFVRVLSKTSASEHTNEQAVGIIRFERAPTIRRQPFY